MLLTVRLFLKSHLHELLIPLKAKRAIHALLVRVIFAIFAIVETLWITFLSVREASIAHAYDFSIHVEELSMKLCKFQTHFSSASRCWHFGSSRTVGIHRIVESRALCRRRSLSFVIIIVAFLSIVVVRLLGHACGVDCADVFNTLVEHAFRRGGRTGWRAWEKRG